MSIVKSRATICVDADTKARFDEVAGINDTKVKLQQIVEFLKHSEDHRAHGAWISKVCGTFSIRYATPVFKRRDKRPNDCNAVGRF